MRRPQRGCSGDMMGAHVACSRSVLVHTTQAATARWLAGATQGGRLCGAAAREHAAPAGGGAARAPGAPHRCAARGSMAAGAAACVLPAAAASLPRCCTSLKPPHAPHPIQAWPLSPRGRSQHPAAAARAFHQPPRAGPLQAASARSLGSCSNRPHPCQASLASRPCQGHACVCSQRRRQGRRRRHATRTMQLRVASCSFCRALQRGVQAAAPAEVQQLT